MSQPSADLLPLIEQAVEMRANGRRWEAIAADLGRHVNTVRRWPTRHRDLWNRLHKDAEARVATESASEAMAFLRGLLRSEDEKIKREAAQQLIQARNKLRELDLKTHTAPRPDSEGERLADYLDDLDEDALDTLADDLHERHEQPSPPA